ncbi:MAG TPA: sigma factor-like helix-turn-helix DNA-binding protein [Anaerolineales bacterium]
MRGQIGRRLGFTRERARQLEAQALKRLRNPDQEPE